MRKQYIIIMKDGDYSDVAWRSTLLAQAGKAGVHSDEILPISAAAIETTGTDVGVKLRDGTRDYGVISRRRFARNLKAALQKACPDFEFKIIELGTFNRETKPVASWTVYRKFRVRQSSGGKWSMWTAEHEWAKGFPLRAEARAQAAKLQKDWNETSSSEGYGEQFKFIARPVYAEVQA